MKNNNYLGYKIFSKILRIAGFVWFGEKVVGKENIPKSGKCILAGNHVSDFDAYLLFAGTKRPIHFLGKKELFEGKMGWFFKMMHLIPVDRKNKNPEAKNQAIEVLNEGKILGIFPEGTYRKKDLLLPFKPGVISFSEKTDALIVPFVILGTFKFRSKPVIKFLPPIDIKMLEGDKLLYLENLIKDELIKYNNEKRLEK